MVLESLSRSDDLPHLESEEVNQALKPNNVSVVNALHTIIEAIALVARHECRAIRRDQ